ncbi:MAG: DUF2974 domain-containing protein [Gammaproteobacteria bacterium]|nr:DUF2974 domain-containing protein [Gammaproteobacteria bacterium]
MQTSFFYASLFSKAAYEKIFELPDSWERAAFFENASGLGISIFNSRREQKTVIAFRGTQNLQNLVSDAQILLQWPISVAEQAKQFYQQSHHLCYSDITFTGHSLGGALASSMALEYGISAIIFDSPGFYSHAQTMPYFRRHEALIYNLVGQPNLVNTCHQHVGTLLFVNTDTYYSSIGAGLDIMRDHSVVQPIAGNNASMFKTIANVTDTALSAYSTGYLHQIRHFIAYLEDSSSPIFRIRTWVNWVNHTQDIHQIPAIIRRYELDKDPIDIKTFSNYQNTPTVERRMAMLNRQRSAIDASIDEATLTSTTSSAARMPRAQSVGGRLAQFNEKFFKNLCEKLFFRAWF